jgi:GTP-binding protein Era
MAEMESPEAGPGWTEAELDLTTLDEELLPAGHRSGFVAVVGRPNVGKSTLMNAYLGQKIAIVSPKPQTTRLRQLGILTTPDYQVVFVDTPGWHVPQHKLGEFMVETAARAIPDADVVLFIVDVSEPVTAEDRLLAQLIEEHRGEAAVIMALNKVDLLQPAQRGPRGDAFRELVPAAESLLLSAVQGDNRDELLELIVDRLPEGPRYYPADQVTDIRTRDLAAELIREQALELLHHEVPHAVAVLVNEFKERSQDLVYVNATIYVEKDSQKGILIGSRGGMLKRIGADARAEMERVLGLRVYLDLWVKVRPKWRHDDSALRQFGYSIPRDS